MIIIIVIGPCTVPERYTAPRHSSGLWSCSSNIRTGRSILYKKAFGNFPLPPASYEHKGSWRRGASQSVAPARTVGGHCQRQCPPRAPVQQCLHFFAVLRWIAMTSI